MSVSCWGDLNDEIGSRHDADPACPPGSEIGTGGFDQPDAGYGQRLWNLAPRMPRAQRYTRISAANVR